MSPGGTLQSLSLQFMSQIYIYAFEEMEVQLSVS